MFRRWMAWALRTAKLALLLTICWLALAAAASFFGALQPWLVSLATVAALATFITVSLFREPMRTLTMARPKVDRSPETVKLWRWLQRRWESLCIASGLAGPLPVKPRARRLFPKVKQIAMGPRGPVLEIAVLVTSTYAQTPTDWVRRTEELASIIGCPVEVRPISAQRVRVELLARAPLREKSFVRLPAQLDLSRPLTIGVRADGTPFRLAVAEKQTLLVGQSGSGKGSVIASILAGLGPGIRDGIVTVDAIDLKGGVEAGSYVKLVRTSAWDYESARQLLLDLVQELDDRLTTMRMGGYRKIEPSVATPLRLLIIDEAAHLIYQAPDAKTRAEVDLLLKRILSTGRAAGYVVIAALQDPRKEALASRDLYTQTLALKFRTRDDAVLALGQSAYDAGARCELIPSATPGTGFAVDGETGDIVQFRAFWVSDGDLREMARIYAPTAREPHS
ncbi:FtsK/SpoIIIE domain-containing protein [Microbacterium sp. NPDC057961]|uniref:FtsK/SpoIIIE domain-containing protein n=2 Tax=unclassified Microbacterium TaxID=2609290 RepID=UPI0036DDDB15